MKHIAEILLIGEYSAESLPHLATEAAIRHATASLQLSPTVRWISTAEVTPDWVRKATGV